MKILGRKITNSCNTMLLSEQVHNWIPKKPSEVFEHKFLVYDTKILIPTSNTGRNLKLLIFEWDLHATSNKFIP